MRIEKIKKAFSIIFAVTFCFSALTATAISDENTAILAPTDRSNEFYANQAESIRIYNDLLDSFITDRASVNNVSTENQAYPDYFGGAYINRETGYLVVKTTELPLAEQFSVSSVRNLSSVTYELCDISYNQMRSVVDDITANLAFFYEQDIEIASVGIDVDASKVRVKVVGLTVEEASVITKITDCAFLQIEDTQPITTEVSIGGGYPATPGYNTNLSSTICCAATRANVDGFVIAGHAVDSLGQEFTSLGNTLGPVTANAYYHGSSADAAFVPAMGSNVEVSNVMYSGGVLFNTFDGVLPDGTRVYKYGVATDLTSGYVEEVGVTVLNNNTTRLVDCVSATYNSSGGDSGGPVMIYEGSFNGASQYTLCGIHSSGSSTTGLRYFSPYSNIVDELGIECITY